MRALVLIAIATLLALPAHAKPTPGVVKADWEALLAAKCDLAAHGVRTPFGASALRNTPYALAGYTFKSEGLRALFTADGGWYQPKGTAAPKFTPEVGACIQKLKAFEATQKPKVGTWNVFKERVFKDHATYTEIRSHSRLMQGGPSEISGTDTDMDVTCKACTGLQLFQVHCTDSECLVIVPGTGDLP
ncbi:MAG: YARHG domain-containing protein [Myxococcales bacterium]|nr:YARHG domain-containing protein [Myxococcales bacterium]